MHLYETLIDLSPALHYNKSTVPITLKGKSIMTNTIGNNIKEKRIKCGFTQEEVANRIAVTPQAVSKWENGGGLPDITQIAPLARLFGVSTDALLGVATDLQGAAHLNTAQEHVTALLESTQPITERHLAAYRYLCEESDREPANYPLMCLCINHGAEISRYTDFDGFLSDRPEEKHSIFADCERRNACIDRYCEDRNVIEKADFAMAWIYLHCQEFDKARKRIDCLPSLMSNNLREPLEAQLALFEHGYASEKEVIKNNMRKLLHATGKEFAYSFEDIAREEKAEVSAAYFEKMCGIIKAYEAFDFLCDIAKEWEKEISQFLPKD